MPPMFMGQGMIGNLSTELVYSFVIILSSLIIYFGTKEFYELSSYKGIKYFRDAFLFFAIALFFRTFIKFILIYLGGPQILALPPGSIGIISLFFFVYASTVAALYLIYSLAWKRLNSSNKAPFLHLIALVFAFLIIIFPYVDTLIGLNAIILIFAILAVWIGYRESKKAKTHSLLLIYVLLFIFWIINIIEVVLPKFFQGIQLLIYLASIAIFLAILYRVLKRIGGD